VRSIVLRCLACLVWLPAAYAADTPPACSAGAKWTEPAPPLKIFGNTWFVGTCGISSILVTSDQGHILIDGGIADDAPLIEANIRQLGFRVEDVRYILNSHEHYDHAGGIARLQHDSGASVLARKPAAVALERGRGDRSDPQLLIGKVFAPVKVVRTIGDGNAVRLATLALTAHATPGHTPGSTSWTWQSCENERCLQIVYADSLSAMSDNAYRYSDARSLGAAFPRSIETVGALPCDILLTPHPDASAMWTRIGAQASAPLVDADACRRYAAAALENLDARLARERDGGTTPVAK
jgi:metallo-beta-lactamase class B